MDTIHSLYNEADIAINLARDSLILNEIAEGFNYIQRALGAMTKMNSQDWDISGLLGKLDAVLAEYSKLILSWNQNETFVMLRHWYNMLTD